VYTKSCGFHFRLWGRVYDVMSCVGGDGHTGVGVAMSVLLLSTL
jgi:hypothetical protein